MHNHDIAAERLRRAYDGEPVAPLRDLIEPGDGAGAYAIQAINTRYWEAQGRRVVGRKVGLTAKAVQVQLGVDQPDFGVLFDDMEVPDGGILATGRLLQPKVEAEVAMILGSDLPLRQVGQDDVAAAVTHAVAAIEIVDSRVANWTISFADTVADNGSSGLFVLGRDRKPLAGLDLWACGMVLERNGEVASLGAGAACLGHPLNAATWLANTLAAQGEPLRRGDIILTGALGPMVPLQSGDDIRVTIAGLGSVSFSYRD